jgi:hypothetical protein
MVGVSGIERLLERISHGFAATLDVLWALPAAARLNRMPLASVAVLALAGLAFAVSSGGLGVPQAARAVPVIPETGPGVPPTARPSASALPSNPAAPAPTPGITFQPIGGGASPEASG